MSASRHSAVVPIAGVLETCLYVDDLDAAEQFYTEVLGMEYYGRQPGRHVFLRCGQQMLLLFDPAASEGGTDIPPHGARGPGHAAFTVGNNDLPAWRERLMGAGVHIEQEVTWPQGGQSLYFRDPAGNSLELTSPAIWGLAGG